MKRNPHAHIDKKMKTFLKETLAAVLICLTFVFSVISPLATSLSTTSVQRVYAEEVATDTASSDSEVSSDTSDDVTEESDIEVETDVDTDIDVDVEVDAEADTSTDSEVDPAETSTEEDPEATEVIDSEGDADVDTEIDVEEEVEVDSDSASDSSTDDSGDIASTTDDTTIDTATTTDDVIVDSDDESTVVATTTAATEEEVSGSGTIITEGTDGQSGATTTTTTTASTTIIQTGDILGVSDVTNVANTNTVNSEGGIEIITATSTASTTPDLDLTSIFEDMLTPHTNTSSTTPTTLASTTSVLDIENTNTATTTNTIALDANTGDNSIINPTNDALIATGSTTLVSNLVNVVNTNIIDSNYGLLVLTKVGDVIGDIILPATNFFTDFLENSFPRVIPDPLDGEGEITISNTNDATVENNINLNAQTGDNTIESDADGSGEIATGDASVLSNIFNLVNTNLINVASVELIFKIAGNWMGDLIGIPTGFTRTNTADGFVLTAQGTTCCTSQTAYAVTDISNTNDATVINNVDLNANTGGNSIAGTGGTIETGDVAIASNVVNVVNTNIVRSNWLLGIINVLGNVTGDIVFGERPTTPPDDGGNNGGGDDTDNGGSDDDDDNEGNGGSSDSDKTYLTIRKTNNARSDINPGDKVSFTIVVTNISGVNIHDATVSDRLVAPDGEVIAVNDWDLGTVAEDEVITLTYDVIFQDNAIEGKYTNTASVDGRIRSGEGIGIRKAKSDVILDINDSGGSSSNPNDTTVSSTVADTDNGIGGGDVPPDFFPGLPNTGRGE